MFHVKLIFLLSCLIPFFSFSQHFGSTTLPVKELPPLPQKSTNILNILHDNKEYGSLNDVQKEWFYWTNYSRSNPKRFWDSVVDPILTRFPTLQNSYTVSLKKDLYSSPQLPLVAPNLKLAQVSHQFASELSSDNAPPSHTSPTGATFSDRMKGAGIINCAGENISFGPSNPVLMLVLLYIDQGVQSLGHRKTLLNPAFVQMGVGVSHYKDGNSIIIQDFACNQK